MIDKDNICHFFAQILVYWKSRMIAISRKKIFLLCILNFWYKCHKFNLKKNYAPFSWYYFNLETLYLNNIKKRVKSSEFSSIYFLYTQILAFVNFLL